MGALTSLSKTETSFWLGISEYGLLFFALVVVVGLIGEHKLPWWHRRLKLFEVLVVIGCGGEVLADGAIFVFSRHLQAISDLEVARLDSEAGTSRERATTLESENIKTAKELAELQKASFPRSLNQKDAAARLLPFRGTEVDVMTVPDFETQRISALLVATFQLAKWPAGYTIMMDVVEGFEKPGVWIEVGDFDVKSKRLTTPSKRASNAADLLVRVLNDNGIRSARRPPTRGVILKRQPTLDHIEVFVSLRPVPGESTSTVMLPKVDEHNEPVKMRD